MKYMLILISLIIMVVLFINMSSIVLLRLHSVSKNLFSAYKCNKYLLNRNINGQYKTVLMNSNIAREVSKSELSNKKKSDVKDKLLFYYENPRFFKFLNIFAIVQFFFWVQMSEFTYSKMKDINLAVDENLPWWRRINFQDKTTRVVVTTVCFLLGYSVLSVAWIYTLRSVRMLVLRKDGKTLSIVTYGPFGRDRILDVPLEKVTTNQTRETAKQQLPIKVQGKWFYYILDTTNGVFKNPELFDYTAGMKRTFKN